MCWNLKKKTFLFLDSFKYFVTAPFYADENTSYHQLWLANMLKYICHLKRGLCSLWLFIEFCSVHNKREWFTNWHLEYSFAVYNVAPIPRS